MQKVIKGTRDLRNYQIIKGTSDQRELRCPKCKGVATQVPDGKGGTICQCKVCKARFKFSSLS